jgi:hypothetical protein
MEKSAQDRYRAHLEETYHAATQSFDKAVMTLSAGGLALSIGFVSRIAPAPVHDWLLVLAWSLFAGSLLLILLSFLTSQEAHLRTMRLVDGDVDPASTDWWGRATTGLNLASALTLIAATATLVLFGALNLGGS